MTGYICLALLVALGAFEVWLFGGVLVDEAVSRFGAWRRQRDAVRRSAADQQLRAMHAAQRISLLAWRARQELYGMAADARRVQARR